MADQEEQGRSTPLPLRAAAVPPIQPSDSGEVGSRASATPYAEPTAKVATDVLASGVAEATTQVALAALRPVEAMLRDPLGEVARKERRSLLGISIIAIFVGWTGLIPHDLTNLGLQFEAPDRAVLLKLFFWVVGYYTAAFVVYAFNDFLSWVYAIYLGRQELKKRRVSLDPVKPSDDTPWSLISLVTPTAVLRGVFDFLVPLVVAGVAMWSLWSAVTQVATNVPTAPAAPAVTPAPSLKTH